MAEELIARLRRLEAAETIREVIHTYCLAVDIGDLALLRSAFTNDVQMHGQYMGDVSGIEGVIAYFEGARAEPTAHRKHYATNFLITGNDGDTVSATCYFFSYHGETDDLHLAWGRYEYKARLNGNGGGAICDITIILDQPVAGLEAFRPAR